VPSEPASRYRAGSVRSARSARAPGPRSARDRASPHRGAHPVRPSRATSARSSAGSAWRCSGASLGSLAASTHPVAFRTGSAIRSWRFADGLVSTMIAAPPHPTRCWCTSGRSWRRSSSRRRRVTAALHATCGSRVRHALVAAPEAVPEPCQSRARASAWARQWSICAQDARRGRRQSASSSLSCHNDHPAHATAPGGSAARTLSLQPARAKPNVRGGGPGPLSLASLRVWRTYRTWLDTLGGPGARLSGRNERVAHIYSCRKSLA
jgi:hypothetical protein